MEIMSSIPDKGHNFYPFCGDFTQICTHTPFNLYFIHTDLNVFVKSLYEYINQIFFKHFKYVRQKKDRRST